MPFETAFRKGVEATGRAEVRTLERISACFGPSAEVVNLSPGTTARQLKLTNWIVFGIVRQFALSVWKSRVPTVPGSEWSPLGSEGCPQRAQLTC